jgi:CHAT domain-containing protein
MDRTFVLFFMIFGLYLSVPAQVVPEAQTLIPGQPVEREIAGGETHIYQIKLAAGQFMHARLDQAAIDLTLAVVGPDGKQLLEVDLNRACDPKSLSVEAVVIGDGERSLGQDLMTKFYEKMLKQGERPSAALRAAKVEVWKQKQWQSPYYWAAFTMQGEWR